MLPDNINATSDSDYAQYPILLIFLFFRPLYTFMVEKFGANVRSGLFPIIFNCSFRSLGAICFSCVLLRVNGTFSQSLCF